MIDPSAKLSVSRQAIVLGISRGSVYYKPRPVSDADLKLMHRIDKLHMEFPFAGSRMLQGLLIQEGFKVGRLHVATLMKRMGIEALYRRPNTSKPAPGAQDLPLSAQEAADHPPQSGLGDGHHLHSHGPRVHLSGCRARLVHRGRVLAWRVSITLEAEFCKEAVAEVLARHGTPELFNTAQGSQFTSIDFIKVLAAREIKSTWMAKAPGATTSSSSVCGGRSNTRRSTCGPMPACLSPAPGSAAISAFTTAAVRIHRLTGKRPIRPTSPRQCPKRQRHNRGRKPLGNRPGPVQINRTTSLLQPAQRSFETGLSQPHGVRGKRYAGLTRCPRNSQQASMDVSDAHRLGAGGRERQTEAPAGGRDARQHRAQGSGNRPRRAAPGPAAGTSSH